MSVLTRMHLKIEGRIWPRIDSEERGAISVSPSIGLCVPSRLSKEPGAVHS